jgi:zinc protease
VIEEWRRGRGAQQRVSDAQMPILFEGSRYPERLPIGQKETLESASIEAIQRFYDDWYRPDLMAVVAVGDFDPEWMLERIREHFEGIEGPPVPRERLIYEIPIFDDVRLSSVTDEELSGASVELQVKLPGRETQTVGDYRIVLAEQLYQQMLNVRFGELVQQPNPPFIGAGNSLGPLMRSQWQYTLQANVDADAVLEGLEAMVRESRRVGLHGFTAGEFERAKARTLRSMQAQFEERNDTHSSVFASRAESHFLEGSPTIGIETAIELATTLLAEIQLEEVNAVHERVLGPANRVLLASGPDDTAFPGEKSLRETLERADAFVPEAYVDASTGSSLLAAEPVAGSIVSAEHHDAVGVTEWRLSNGARVLLKPTDYKQDEILMQGFSPGGYSRADDQLQSTAELISYFAEAGGMGELDAIALQKFLAGRRVSFQGSVGELGETVQGAFSPEDSQLFFQILHARFTALRRDDVAFAALQQRFIAYLENRELDPGSAFGDSLSAILSQHHPRRRPIDAKRLAAIDYERGFAFMEDRFADASDFVFAFVGKFTPEEIRPWIEKYVASLPARERDDAWIDRGIRPPDGVIKRAVYAGQDKKSNTAVIFHGDFQWERKNLYTLHALARALEIRLRERLREDLGGTYSVGVSGNPQREPYLGYSLSVQFGSDPDRVDELVAAMWEELHRMRDEGPDEELLGKLKEAHRRDYEEGLQENGWWLAQILFRARHGRPLEETVEYLPLVDALSVEDLREAAARYIRDDQFVQLSLFPEGWN